MKSGQPQFSGEQERVSAVVLATHSSPCPASPLPCCISCCALPSPLAGLPVNQSEQIILLGSFISNSPSLRSKLSDPLQLTSGQSATKGPRKGAALEHAPLTSFTLTLQLADLGSLPPRGPIIIAIIAHQSGLELAEQSESRERAGRRQSRAKQRTAWEPKQKSDRLRCSILFHTTDRLK